MEKLRNKTYLELIEMQSKCNRISIHDSIELTELIKVGQTMEVAHYLMKLLVKADEPKHETVDQWIKVKDKLPERSLPDKPVKIWVTYNGYTSVAYYSDEGEFCTEWDGSFYYGKIWGVTHWMPLPIAPGNNKERV